MSALHPDAENLLAMLYRRHSRGPVYLQPSQQCHADSLSEIGLVKNTARGTAITPAGISYHLIDAKLKRHCAADQSGGGLPVEDPQQTQMQLWQ